jgi:hypothetical protein
MTRYLLKIASVAIPSSALKEEEKEEVMMRRG